MTREHSRILNHWRATIERAIELGEADAAYRLTVGAVRRAVELGVL